MATLTDSIRDLAATRQSLADVTAQVKAARAAFDTEHAELLASQKVLAAQAAAEEANVKALTLVAYQGTDEKKPAAGVEVKLFDTMEYAPADGFAWAKSTGLALVPESLDVRAFEKIAKATPLPFVTYGQEPRVTIASDLDKALAVAAVIAPAPVAEVTP